MIVRYAVRKQSPAQSRMCPVVYWLVQVTNDSEVFGLQSRTDALGTPISHSQLWILNYHKTVMRNLESVRKTSVQCSKISNRA